MASPFQNKDGDDYVREIEWNGYDSGLKPEVVAVLNAAQQLVDFPIRLNSGYRSPARNKAAGGAKKSQHLTGNAVDVSVKGLTNAQRTQLTRALAQSGATRIGAYSGNTAIHLDMAQGFGKKSGYSVYPMYDRSSRNMDRAPSWFKDGLDGTKVSFSPTAPIPASISPAITEKRRQFSEGNAATRAIDGAIGTPQPNGMGYSTTSVPKTPVSIPPGFDSPRGMEASALYSGIIPKLDAATKWNDGGKGTPIQVANFDRMTDRDPYGIGSPPPVTPLPKLSAPGAGATVQQRNAIAAVPQATERRYNPDTNTWTAKQTLQPRPASNAPGQTFGVGGANQAGTTQMPRDVRPSSVPAAPALNPMLAAAVEKYEGKKAPVQGLMKVVPGRDNRVPAAPTPLPYSAGQAARSRVASLEPMPLPAIKPSMTAPMPLPRSAGDAARAKAAAQYPMVAPPMAPPIPLPYSAGVAARAKAAVPTAPVLQYSGTLKKSDPWETVLGGVDEWWQATPAGRLGNVLGGKPQVPSRTGIPEAFLEMISGKPKAPAPQPPARKQPAFFGLLGNSGGGLFGGGGIFGGGQRNPGILASMLGGSSGSSGGGPAILTPQGNVHPGGWYDNSGNDMAYMPRSYQENPRNSNGGY